MALKKSKSLYYRKFRVYIISTALGVIASGIALVLFSVLVFFARMPVSGSGFFSLLAFGAGCIVAGFAAGVSKRQGGLATGIKAALLFTVPILFVSVVISGLQMPSPEALEAVESSTSAVTAVGFFGKIITAILCGGIGGVLGVNKNNGF